MFTGLVERTGWIVSIREAGEGKRIEIEAGEFFADVDKGESISVSGACLTVEEFTDSGAIFFLAEETLDRTWFSELSAGDELNLEKSLTPADRMGGHYVQGHVDDTSRILEVEEMKEGWNLRFSIPGEVSEYIVEKGFVAIDGISLTVSDVGEESFEVTIIPETWDITNLSTRETGDSVNIEADIMAKYAEKAAGKS
ncbi:MAG: riboflavin synthase [Candidatus Nanohaloarchaea archaeon]